MQCTILVRFRICRNINLKLLAKVLNFFTVCLVTTTSVSVFFSETLMQKHADMIHCFPNSVPFVKENVQKVTYSYSDKPKYRPFVF